MDANEDTSVGMAGCRRWAHYYGKLHETRSLLLLSFVSLILIVPVYLQNESDAATMKEMYKEWPWFRELIDLIAMILSKTDFSIAENYDNQLVDKSGDLKKLGEEVREKLVQTRQAILDVTQSHDVAGVHVALQRASSVIRHPYVDPVNVIQAELLKRLRALEKKGDNLTPDEVEESETLKDALKISINGIAQGMRNSG